MIGKFLLALSIATVVATVGAGSASALTAAETQEASWVNGGGRYAEGAAQAVTCSNSGANIENTEGGASVNFQLTGKVLAKKLWLTATGIECPEMAVKNVSALGVHMASATGKLKLTGVTVMEPPGCQIAATLTTEPLAGDLKMDTANVNVSLLELKAAVGAKIGTVKLENCAFAGNYPITGTFFALMTNATTVLAKSQPFAFTEPEAEMSSLKVGGEGADIFGEMGVERGGETWGAKKE